VSRTGAAGAATRRYGRDREDAIALVTGGGRGIGQACAMALAEDGVTIAVADIDAEAASETVAAIEATGGRASAIECDVSDESSSAAGVQAAVDRYGHLDCAVNAAGIVVPTSGLTGSDWDIEVFDRIVAVNLRGVMLSVKHELRPMVGRGSGSIVNIASAAAFIGVPGGVAYTASKHGVVGVTRAAALEYAASGVRINAVCPGGVRTRMLAGFEDLQGPTHPIGRLAEPMEIATAVRWLCSSDSSFVLGAAILVDGGITAQ
jgi:NAD(P)-dependent dehydrogenase (short-subunit alcohol dehydrogenase family)